METTPLLTRALRTTLILIVASVLLLLLLATLTYVYFSWRAKTARKPQQLYWLYRMSLMVLNQLGFQRAVLTPQEYAGETIDPQFGTEFEKFMQIYQKAKYAPVGLADDESRFVDDFSSEFRQKVFGAYSRWDIIKNFLNFIRTLRFFSVK